MGKQTSPTIQHVTRAALIVFMTVGLAFGGQNGTSKDPSPLRFEVSFPAQQSDKPIDGRVYVMLSKDDKEEPRFEVGTDPDTQQFFGVDVDALAPGKPATIDTNSLGYPVAEPALTARR